MILTGPEIHAQVEAGQITIDPFDSNLLNPNSYNYRLGRTLKQVISSPADPTRPAETAVIDLPKEGYLLRPGVVYLGATMETIGGDQYVTRLIGRSSLGRLGMFLQISADLGNLGSAHQWTLEITVVQRLRVYPQMRVGQVSFWKPVGARKPYGGLYGGISEPTACSPRAAAGLGAALIRQEAAA
ncbi:dCTP deaminase [Streptomyces chartreusis]|uniref:Deoxycytidine deaminase n=1 Tax=Streptomyces chartreusis TaxID=1969 RepID=A0A7H8TKY1_STRCX|nr:deoxycytidine deaminase [Streptomyces chartreusis]QKZ23897.1 deoxycytidine deaminase [Streptomyces chartreusis]